MSFFFWYIATVASSTPSLNWKDLVPKVETLLNGTYLNTGDSSPSLEYLARSDGTVSLTYVMQIRNLSPMNHLWVEAFVCAHSGKVVGVTDFTAHATVRQFFFFFCDVGFVC